MYAAPNLYSTQVFYIDLPDDEFFAETLKRASLLHEAGKLDEYSPESIKKMTPVVFASTLSKRSDAEDVISRKDVNSDRAQRKFLMIDADFDPGQERESDLLRKRLIDLAEEHSTPILVYPTISYPEKPRFRAVLFTKRVMKSDNYFQAVNWLYDSLDWEIMDASDTRMSANRNAPIFNSDSQIEQVYSTIGDEGLAPLDNILWRDYPKPPKKKPHIDYAEMNKAFEGIELDPTALVTGARKMAHTKIASRYETFWRVAESIAASVVSGQITLETAHKMLDALAEAADTQEKQDRWTEQNKELLSKHMKIFEEDPTRMLESRSLPLYTEFTTAIR